EGRDIRSDLHSALRRHLAEISQEFFCVHVNAVIARVGPQNVGIKRDGRIGSRHHRTPDWLTRALTTRMPEAVRKARNANTRQATEPAHIWETWRPNAQ